MYQNRLGVIQEDATSSSETEIRSIIQFKNSSTFAVKSRSAPTNYAECLPRHNICSDFKARILILAQVLPHKHA